MDRSTLATKRCLPCHGGMPTLSADEVDRLRLALPDWQVEDGRRLRRTFRFRDFAGPMALANRVAAVAEDEGHHPDLHVHWGRLVVELTTHAVRGLTENDFIVAAKVDRLLESP